MFYSHRSHCVLFPGRRAEGARCSATGELKLCPGSGLNGWSFNQSTGDCQFVELCPNPETEMKSTSNGERSSQRRTNNKWQGIWQAKNGALTAGVYATRSACQYHCLPKPPRGTDAQSTFCLFYSLPTDLLVYRHLNQRSG